MSRPKGRKKIFPRHGSGFDIEAVRILKARAEKEGRPISEILEDAKINKAKNSDDGNISRKSSKRDAPSGFGISREEARELLKDQE